MFLSWLSCRHSKCDESCCRWINNTRLLFSSPSIIEYYKSGRLRNYLPDLLVVFSEFTLLYCAVLKILFNHYLKCLFRNTKFDANFVLKLMIAFSIFYFCFIVIYLGANFTKILCKVDASADPINFFNEYLVYLIPIDFLFRFFFQKSNFRVAIPYMHFPVRRDKITLYILITKLFNIFNLYALLFIIPFSVINILPNYGWDSFILYLSSFLAIMIFMTLFIFLIKNLAYYNVLFALIPAIWLMVTILLKVLFQMNPETFTSSLFADVISGNYLIVVLFVLLTTIITIISIKVVNRLIYYVLIDSEEYKLNKKAPNSALLVRSSKYYFLLELSLMLRNKRIRQILIIPIYFTILTYIVFLVSPISDIYSILFWYLCLSGVWGYSYLQVEFSLESSFFDFISTVNFDFNKYFKAKYIFIVVVSFLSVLISIPIIIIGNQNVHIVASALLYNIGIGYFLVFISAIFNKERLELNSSVFFNYQGYSAIQVISICIAIILPVAFLGISTLLFNVHVGLSIINIICIISLLNYKKWFQLILNQLSKRKYINLEGFRK